MGHQADAFLGHAVDAAQVTAVSHRDAQIINGTLERIGQSGHIVYLSKCIIQESDSDTLEGEINIPHPLRPFFAGALPSWGEGVKLLLRSGCLN